jgi:hypothetical protein
MRINELGQWAANIADGIAAWDFITCFMNSHDEGGIVADFVVYWLVATFILVCLSFFICTPLVKSRIHRRRNARFRASYLAGYLANSSSRARRYCRGLFSPVERRLKPHQADACADGVNDLHGTKGQKEQHGTLLAEVVSLGRNRVISHLIFHTLFRQCECHTIFARKALKHDTINIYLLYLNDDQRDNAVFTWIE